MPGSISCFCTPVQSTCLADWLISLKTKTRPAPAFAAGFAPKGVTGPAHREEGLDTQSQGFVEGAASRGRGFRLLFGRPLSVSARASSRLSETCLPSSPTTPYKSPGLCGCLAVALLVSSTASARPAPSGPRSRPLCTARTPCPARGRQCGAARWGRGVSGDIL